MPHTAPLVQLVEGERRWQAVQSALRNRVVDDSRFPYSCASGLENPVHTTRRRLESGRRPMCAHVAKAPELRAQGTRGTFNYDAFISYPP